jgi:hypothetical protein
MKTREHKSIRAWEHKNIKTRKHKNMGAFFIGVEPLYINVV